MGALFQPLLLLSTSQLTFHLNGTNEVTLLVSYVYRPSNSSPSPARQTGGSLLALSKQEPTKQRIPPPSVPEPAATSGTHMLRPKGSACSHIARDSVLPLFTEQINTFRQRVGCQPRAARHRAGSRSRTVRARVNGVGTPVRWQTPTHERSRLMATEEPTASDSGLYCSVWKSQTPATKAFVFKSFISDGS